MVGIILRENNLKRIPNVHDILIKLVILSFVSKMKRYYLILIMF